MSRFYKGLILIIMMFGHNFVINQAQSLQTQLQQIHQVNTTQFNWNLYSLPSAMCFIFIIPLGILYDKYAFKILIIGSLAMLLGQTLIALFGPYGQPYFFSLLVSGRIFQAIGAEVLYMIQGNLASTWMGKMAGLIFILPQIGQIGNVFVTPFFAEQNNIAISLKIGFFAIAISFLSCIVLYVYLKKQAHKQKSIKIKQDKQKIIEENIKSQDTVDLEEEPIKNKSSPTKNAYYLQKNDQNSKNKDNNSVKLNNQNTQASQKYINQQQLSIFKAGKVFWLMISLCAINQCLYFPFFDNATQHIETRFLIEYNRTGLYLCLPFISAMIITAIHGQYILHHFSRVKLILYCSFIPFIGHMIIYLIPNSINQQSIIVQIFLIVGLSCFGMGIGSYYSVSFAAIGYTVPEKIRGTAYALLCFCQTISMTFVPILSGYIIDSSKEANNKPTGDGFKNSSLLFVLLSLIGVGIAFGILKFAKKDSFKYQQQQQNNQKQHKMDYNLQAIVNEGDNNKSTTSLQKSF